MIIYIGGRFSVNGLNLPTMGAVEEVLEKMVLAMRLAHPSLRFDADVELEIDETAGTEEKVLGGGR